MYCPLGSVCYVAFMLAIGAPQGADRLDRSAAPKDHVEELHITGHSTDRAALAETWTQVPLDRIQRSDARSVADVLRRAPGALVQTNSRGQTLVVLRNAGERQVSIFFDGAPLEIPWDHRIDLALIPASVIGRTEVARGPLSNRYGPRVSGGAVFLEPLELHRETAAGLTAEGGSAGLLRLDGALGFSPAENLSLLAAVDSTEWAGVPLAGDQPFSQSGDELRTNTDARRTSAFARVAVALARTELTVTLLHGGSVLGAAPEGHLDPSTEPVRYWRYPDTDLTMVIASMETGGRTWAIDAVAWGQAYTQTIESFTSVRYNRLAQSQMDRDRSLGGRVRMAGVSGPHQLSVSAYGSLSSHHEVRVDRLVPSLPIEHERFRHGLWSTGVDYQLNVDSSGLRIGAGFDGLEPLETAGRSSGRIRGWNASAGGHIDLTSAFALRVAVGSRVRLPTPRELFGTALDRFVSNEALRAERTTSIEAAITYANVSTKLELVPFAGWTDDTLEQENVIVHGTARRRRINAEGSRVLGLEIIAALDFASWIRAAGQLLLSDVRRFGGGRSSPVRTAFDSSVRRGRTGTRRWARSSHRACSARCVVLPCAGRLASGFGRGAHQSTRRVSTIRLVAHGYRAVRPR